MSLVKVVLKNGSVEIVSPFRRTCGEGSKRVTVIQLKRVALLKKGDKWKMKKWIYYKVVLIRETCCCDLEKSWTGWERAPVKDWLSNNPTGTVKWDGLHPQRQTEELACPESQAGVLWNLSSDECSMNINSHLFSVLDFKNDEFVKGKHSYSDLFFTAEPYMYIFHPLSHLLKFL